MIIAWWSAGVTSAVATKLAIDEYGVDNVIPIYFHIGSAHEDNARFKAECEEWYGREIITESAAKYDDQFDVIRKDKYVNGPGGARCTLVLKKRVRQRIEKERQYDGQVFGFEYSKKEINRAIRLSPTAWNRTPPTSTRLCTGTATAWLRPRDRYSIVRRRRLR